MEILVPNCATPDADYSVEGSALGLLIKIKTGKPGMWDRLTLYQRLLISQRAHDAILPVIEMIYAMTWDEMWAGTGDPPYPARHSDMHFERPASPTSTGEGDGR